MQNFRKTTISIEYCQQCHKHPHLGHSQSLYQTALRKIQKELEKKSDHLRIVKQKSFREGAFQVKLDNILLYSKLSCPSVEMIKITPHELNIMVDSIISKTEEQIYRLKMKQKTSLMRIDMISQVQKDSSLSNEKKFERNRKRVMTLDLYGYFQSKLKGHRFTIKLVNNLLLELIGVQKIPMIKHLKSQRRFVAKNTDKYSNKMKKIGASTVQIQELVNDESSCQLQKIVYEEIVVEPKAKNGLNLNRSIKSSFKHKTKQNELKNSNLGTSIDKKISKNSEILNEKINVLSRFKDKITQQGYDKINKYAFLTKEMDKKEKSEHDQEMYCLFSRKNAILYQNSKIQTEKIHGKEDEKCIELLELSDDMDSSEPETEFEYLTEDQRLKKIIKREGLILNVPNKIVNVMNQSRKKNSKRYSFQFNKDMESIEKELKKQFGESFRQNTNQNEGETSRWTSNSDMSSQKKDKSVKIQEPEDSFLSSDSFDLMSREKLDGRSQKYISVREIYSNNRIKIESDDEKTESLPSIDLKLMTKQFYTEMENAVCVNRPTEKVISSFKLMDEEQKLLTDQYLLTPLHSSQQYTALPCLSITQSFFPKIHNTMASINFEHFLNRLLLLEKIFQQQISQVFKIIDYRKVTIESYLYLQMKDEMKDNLYSLDSEINLDEHFIRLNLFDHHMRASMQLVVSLSVVKKMRNLIVNQCRTIIPSLRKVNEIDWISIMYVGYLVCNYWQKNYEKGELILERYKEKNVSLENWIKMIGGCPIIRVAAVDLRKVKHILVNQNFGQKVQSQRGLILCTNNNAQETIVESQKISVIQQFSIDEHNFLNSQLKVRNPQTNTYQLFTYQQFALFYSELFFCFSHTQSHSLQLACTPQNIQLRTNPSWKIMFSLPSQISQFHERSPRKSTPIKNRLLFEYSSKVKDKQQQSEITIVLNRINKKMKHGKIKVLLEQIGSIERKDTFFFELELEQGQYICEIVKEFGNGEPNYLRIWSQNKVEVVAQEFSEETDMAFISKNMQST